MFYALIINFIEYILKFVNAIKTASFIFIIIIVIILITSGPIFVWNLFWSSISVWFLLISSFFLTVIQRLFLLLFDLSFIWMTRGLVSRHLFILSKIYYSFITIFLFNANLRLHYVIFCIFLSWFQLSSRTWTIVLRHLLIFLTARLTIDRISTACSSDMISRINHLYLDSYLIITIKVSIVVVLYLIVSLGDWISIGYRSSKILLIHIQIIRNFILLFHEFRLILDMVKLFSLIKLLIVLHKLLKILLIWINVTLFSHVVRNILLRLRVIGKPIIEIMVIFTTPFSIISRVILHLVIQIDIVKCLLSNKVHILVNPRGIVIHHILTARCFVPRRSRLVLPLSSFGWWNIVCISLSITLIILCVHKISNSMNFLAKSQVSLWSIHLLFLEIVLLIKWFKFICSMVHLILALNRAILFGLMLCLVIFVAVKTSLNVCQIHTTCKFYQVK